MDRRERTDIRERRRRARQGVAAGLVGGVAFGVLLMAFGMMDMVARAVGADSLAVAWMWHLSVSATFGAVMALVARPELDSAGTIDGLVWGFVLWLLGGTLALRTWLGMSLALTDAVAIRSLLGHVVFGAVVWFVLALLESHAGNIAPDGAPASA